MNIWQRINPANRLFGRIFIWFWLATFVMLFSAIWLTRQFSMQTQLLPIQPEARQKLEAAARVLGRAAEQIGPESPSLLLSRLGARHNVALMLVDARSRHFIYGFPRPLRPEKAPFMQLLDQSMPYSIRTASGVFHGPLNIELGNQKYLLFVGNPLPPGLVQRMVRQHPALMLGSAIVVSGILCALLAWSLIRPIRQLQRAASQMAEGDLSARVEGANRRGDELGQLGREFNRMSAQIEQLVAAQKRLLGDISHELRSPLARLQLAIGIAQEQGDPQPQLARIEREAQQIEQMLQQTLQLSRLEVLQDKLELQSVSLTMLLESLVEDARFEAGMEGKTVEMNIDREVWLQADPMLLGSALENVLRNAVKYCSTKVQVRTLSQKTTIQIEVKDDGPGVPQGALKQLFNAFYRVSDSRSRQSGGVGLGLAIAHRAVSAHRGTLSAKNSEEGGLCISICLPQAKIIE